MHRGHVGGSEERLWQLIEERTRTGADTETLDRRIWDLFGETWAIVFTDLAGFSRKVEEFGIIHFLQVIHMARRVLDTDQEPATSPVPATRSPAAPGRVAPRSAA